MHHILKGGGFFQKVIVQFSIYDLALKPLVINENVGLRSLIFDKNNFSLVQKCPNSTDSWLGNLHKKVEKHFF